MTEQEQVIALTNKMRDFIQTNSLDNVLDITLPIEEARMVLQALEIFAALSSLGFISSREAQFRERLAFGNASQVGKRELLDMFEAQRGELEQNKEETTRPSIQEDVREAADAVLSYLESKGWGPRS